MRSVLPLLSLLLASMATAASAQRPGTVPEARCKERRADSSCSLYGPSLIELIANPLPYEGKRVRVVGYLHLEFEGNAIYVHREDLEHAINANGLWVDFAPGTLKSSAPCVDSYALVEGTFTLKHQGHFGMWSGAITDITRCIPWR